MADFRNPRDAGIVEARLPRLVEAWLAFPWSNRARTGHNSCTDNRGAVRPPFHGVVGPSLKSTFRCLPFNGTCIKLTRILIIIFNGHHHRT